MTDKSGSCRVVTFAPVKSLDNFTQERLEEFFDVVSVDYTDNGLEIYKGYKNASFKEEELAAFIAANGLDLPPARLNCSKAPTGSRTMSFSSRRLKLKTFSFTAFTKRKRRRPTNWPFAFMPPPLSVQNTRPPNPASGHSASSTEKTCRTPVFSTSAPAREYCRWPLPNFGAKPRRLPPVDIDEEAVIVTRGNAEDNGLEKFITAGVSNGYQSELVSKNAPYDIIFANILARPLIEMAPDLAQNLKPGGFCILSGFVGDQENWVIKAHEEQGLSLVKIYEMDNWRAALMEKKA